MSKRFLFYRPVAPKSSEAILEVTQEILTEADFIRSTGRDAMHLTLLTERMLQRSKIPKSFNPHYTSYEANRRNFVSKDTVAWEPADISPTGAKGIFGALVINTEKPEWLSHERNSARKVANIQYDQMALKNDAYSPHITVGRFIGTDKDWDGFYECERLLQATWAKLGTITLQPLRLIYGEHSWEFQHRQRSNPPVEEQVSA